VRDKGKHTKKITREKEHDHGKKDVTRRFRKFSCDAAFIRTARTFSIYSVHDSSAGHRTAGSPRGQDAIGIFLLFGAVIRLLRGTTLLWRGTALDRMWTLNPRAYKELHRLERVGIPFLMLGASLVACMAWFKRRFGDGGWLWLSSQFRFGRPSECIQG